MLRKQIAVFEEARDGVEGENGGGGGGAVGGDDEFRMVGKMDLRGNFMLACFERIREVY